MLRAVDTYRRDRSGGSSGSLERPCYPSVSDASGISAMRGESEKGTGAYTDEDA
jgi:hypothetical protein